MPARPQISVVIPLLNEREVVGELHDRLLRVLEQMGEEFEVLFVDDGSTDETPEILGNLCQKDPRLKAVFLSRNFGHQMAISATTPAAVLSSGRPESRATGSPTRGPHQSSAAMRGPVSRPTTAVMDWKRSIAALRHQRQIRSA